MAETGNNPKRKSIRVGSDGLSFLELKQYVQDHPEMIGISSLLVVVDSLLFHIIPSGAIVESLSLLNQSFPASHSEEALIEQLSGANLVVRYCLSKDTYRFIHRTFDEAKIVSTHSLMLSLALAQPLAQKSLHAFLIGNRLTLIATEDGKLALVSSYQTLVSFMDIVYYTLHVWDRLGYNQECDRLTFYAEGVVDGRLKETVGEYIRNIHYVEQYDLHTLACAESDHIIPFDQL